MNSMYCIILLVYKFVPPPGCGILDPHPILSRRTISPHTHARAPPDAVESESESE